MRAFPLSICNIVFLNAFAFLDCYFAVLTRAFLFQLYISFEGLSGTLPLDLMDNEKDDSLE